MQIHNCHMHVFTVANVPDKFLPFGLVRFLAKRDRTRGVARFLHGLNPFSDDDTFDRYATFLQISTLGGQQDIFKNIRRFYPDDTRFVALSMDMEFMGCGGVKQGFFEQLSELAELKKAYPTNLLPFLCVDPRRDKLLDLVKDCIENMGFAGLKLYPPLGFFPYDPRLNEVWKYAAANDVPVVAHTSKGGVYYRGTIDVAMLAQSRIEKIDTKGRSNAELCNYFAHPKHYDHLMQDHPGLKLSMAHFGGDREWKAYLDDPPVDAEENWLNIVMKLVKKHPTLYTDISYTLCHTEFTNYLKVLLQDEELKKKILLGSDYFLVERDTSEKRFSIDLRATLGEQDYQLIAERNPKMFLGVK